MRFKTEIWIKTTKSPVEPVLRFRSGIEALTINQDGNIGYNHNEVTTWYSSGGSLLSTFKEPKPRHVTLPRINLVGSDKDIIEQIELYAGKLVGFSLGYSGRYPDGTLYLIDLYGESNAQTGMSSFDVAIVLSTSMFNWSGARKVPAYLGWIGLNVPDLPGVARRSRYKRDPVI
jgi:hypothetical protein